MKKPASILPTKQIVAIQGFCDRCGGRLTEYDIRRIELANAAAVQNDDLIAHRKRFRFAARDMQKGDAQPAADAAQFAAHPHAQIGVERAERFVEQNEARLGDERARQGDALALSAGNLVDPARFETGEADEVDHRVHALAQFVFHERDALRTVLKAKGDVRKNRKMRKQRKILEDETDAAAERRRADHLTTGENDRSRIRIFEAGDDAQQHCLARTARAKQRNITIAGNIETDIVESGRSAVSLRQPDNL